jgi:hypothetical protein
MRHSAISLVGDVRNESSMSPMNYVGIMQGVMRTTDLSAAKSILRNCSGSRRMVSENFPRPGVD